MALRPSLTLAALAVALSASLARAQWTPTGGPTGGALHYLAAAEGALLGAASGPLFRFDGTDWSVVDGVLSGRLLAAGADVYADAAGGFLRSTDGGQTFAPVPTSAPAWQLLNADGPRVVAWASPDTFHVSSDGGATWLRVRGDAWVSTNGSPPFRVGLSNVAGVLMEGETALAAGTAYVFAGVYRLAPSDTAWVRVFDFGSQVHVRSFVRHDGTLFIGSTAGVHASADGGQTWESAATGLSGYAGPGVYLSAGPAGLYARVASAFFQWTGGGWTALPAFPDGHPAAVTAGDRLYATSFSAAYAFHDGAWEALPPHVGSTPIPVYAAGPTAVVRSEGRLMRTDDTGATWQLLTPLSGHAYAEADRLLAVTTSGMRRSADGGQTWTAAGTVPLPTAYNTQVPGGFAGLDGAIYAAYGVVRIGEHGIVLGRFGGVFRSADGGASWTDVSAGLPQTGLGRAPVRLLAPVGAHLFARTDDGCLTWNGAAWAAAACPPGASTSSVVTAGARWLALGSNLVYASDDLGATWADASAGLPGPAAAWFSARLVAVDDTPLAVVEDAGVVRAYRYDGAGWHVVGLAFPAGVRWAGFAGGGGVLYGGAIHRGIWTAPFGATTDGGPAAPAPAVLALSAVTPNPAAGPAVFTLTLPEAGPATVAVYDALGRRVAMLIDGPLTAGAHRLALDTAALPPGVYVVRAAAAQATVSRRLVVAR